MKIDPISDGIIAKNRNEVLKMKKLIGYKEIVIPEKNVHGYTFFYADSDISVDDGTWCGSVYLPEENVTGVPVIGKEFDFSFKPIKGTDGKQYWKPNGVIFI